MREKLRILSVLNLFTFLIFSFSTRADFLDLKNLSYYEEQNIQRKIKLKSEVKKLKKAKYFLVNGNSRKARRELLMMGPLSEKLEAIRLTYLAQVALMEDNPEEGLRYLESELFNGDNAFKQICTLKVTFHFLLNNLSKLRNDFQRCTFLGETFSPTQHVWFETLRDIKFPKRIILSSSIISGPAYFASSMSSIDRAILWLKQIIYLNQEKKIHHLLSSIPVDYYKNEEIRELIAFVYYRLRNFPLAVALVEDLDTPNAENLKGNIYLERGMYELAFGHFRLAIKTKQNSANALQRLVPLSWILGAHKQGLSYLRKLEAQPQNAFKKNILESVFLLRNDQFDEAIKNMTLTEDIFSNSKPLEYNQLLAYSYLRKGDMQNFLVYASQACNSYDGLHCYFLHQLQNWENIGLTMNKREERLKVSAEFSLRELKKRQPLKPIEEPLYLDQRDIEELDSSSVILRSEN